MSKPNLDDYVDVADRIRQFHEKFPEGTLQTLDWSIHEPGGRTFIVYHAGAFRTPDDERPGHGIAWEPFPGPTQFTKDSELMNAETAAWGRACVAVGIPAKKIATRQDIEARNGHSTEEPKASKEEQKLILEKAAEAKLPTSVLANVMLWSTGSPVKNWQTEEDADTWVRKALPQLPARNVTIVVDTIKKETRA